jgi:hypothetical protein
MANLTRGEILQAVEEDGRIATSIDTTKANEWFNDFEQDIHELQNDICPIQNSSRITYIVTKENNSGALPDDFSDINAYDLGFFMLDNNSEKDYKLGQTGEGETAEGYYIDGDTIYFTGLNNGIKNIKLWYTPTLERKTEYNETDELIVSTRFRQLAYYYIAYKYFEDEEELENKVEYKGLYDEQEARYIDRYNRDKKPFMYNTSPLTGVF